MIENVKIQILYLQHFAMSYIVVIQESKKLKNAVIMPAYKFESAVYAITTKFYKDNEKVGQMILKEIFTGDADRIPDYNYKKLTIRLTPRAKNAVKKLYTFLNTTQTCFLYTNLQLVYETLAKWITKVVEV